MGITAQTESEGHMTQKRSRKRGTKRSSTTKKPELRTAKKNQGETAAQARARAARLATERRNRKFQSKRLAAKRVRPDGRNGAASLQIAGWGIVGLTLALAWWTNRLWTTDYPDSIWLWVSIGSLLATIAIAYVARVEDDVAVFIRATAAVSVLLLAIEYVTGPKCPPHVHCGTIGARGQFTLPGSLVLIAVFAVASWYGGRWLFRFVAKGRPANGYESLGVMWTTVFLTTMVVVVPMLATITGVDVLVRKDPARADDAVALVEDSCFGLSQPPVLAVRTNPETRSDAWSSYLVRKVGEKRTGLKGKSLGGFKGDPTPYEAVVDVSHYKEVKSPSPACRKLNSNEKADKHDYEAVPDDQLKSSPLRPQDAFDTSKITPPPPAPPVKKPAKTSKKK